MNNDYAYKFLAKAIIVNLFNDCNLSFESVDGNKVALENLAGILSDLINCQKLNLVEHKIEKCRESLLSHREKIDEISPQENYTALKVAVQNLLIDLEVDQEALQAACAEDSLGWATGGTVITQKTARKLIDCGV